MRLFFAFALIALTAGAGAAEHLWANNITVNEYYMTWNYTETFTGSDSIAYRMNIDKEGNNDGFVSAWELIKADKDVRKNLKSKIDKEMNVRINNLGIEVADVNSMLSPDIIGRTNISDIIVNRYNVTYRFNNSVFNAGSIWLLGQAKIPVTIVMPAGVDVISVRGLYDDTKNITDHLEIAGFFNETPGGRGEITLGLARNTSFRVPGINVSNITSPLPADNVTTGNVTTGNITKPMASIFLKIRDAGIIAAGLVIILLIYVFKVKGR